MYIFVYGIAPTAALMSKKLIVLLFALFLFSQKGEAQFFSSEIGVYAGPAFFYSDYGQRNDFGTNIGNLGFNVGIVHYMNFAYTRNYSLRESRFKYFKNHFKIRNELSYTKVNLQHFGEYVDDSKTSIQAQQLRGMRGQSTIFSVGTNLEYYPFSLRAFEYGYPRLAPHIGIGVAFNFYTPEATSELGVLGDPRITPEKYIDAFTNESGSVLSLVGTLGARYKITRSEDLLFNLTWRHFFSDWVDGINPDPNLYPENKSNDWIFAINVGYIFYLE